MSPDEQCELLRGALIEGGLVEGKDFSGTAWNPVTNRPMIYGDLFTSPLSEAVVRVFYRAALLVDATVGRAAWCWPCYSACAAQTNQPSPDCESGTCDASFGVAS